MDRHCETFPYLLCLHPYEADNSDLSGPLCVYRVGASLWGLITYMECKPFSVQSDVENGIDKKEMGGRERCLRLGCTYNPANTHKLPKKTQLMH